ncbi:hypothetical protein B0H14DRAFT_204573 [Mycena olivaceomarginata]|nr:hypothetical protein B0H14DRAFT_204573 [Mycena olivaceomarginata]
MTCSSPMTLRDFSHAQPLYSGAVHIFDLPLDPHYLEEIPFCDPFVITSIFTSRRALPASIVRISDAAALHFIGTASHPSARQFLPANHHTPLSSCLIPSTPPLHQVHYTVAYLCSTLIWAWTNLAGAALRYLTTSALLCVQDLVVTRSKLMGFHMYRTCGDQPPQGCGGIQFVLANFTIVALLSFVRW